MNRFIPLILVLLLLSCGPSSFDTKKELLQYLNEEENGYIQYKSVNGVDFTLLYRPTDLMVVHELPSSFQTGDVEALKKKYEDYAYFILSMGRNNREVLTNVAGDKGLYRRMLQQFTFGMDQTIRVTTQQKDTLPIVDYIYPRMYDLDGKNTIMFLLKRTDEAFQGDHINIAIADLGLKIGEVTFRFPTKAIRNEPKLNFK